MTNPNGVTVKDVCVLKGPGYGQCWGCPVTQCVLHVEPTNPFSAETLAVAHAAASRLMANRTVVQGAGGRELVEGELEAATTSLALAITDPVVQARLQLWIAAEAVVQGLVDGRAASIEDDVYREWFKRVGNRPPTEAEDLWLESQLAEAKVDAAATAYGVKDRHGLRAAVDHLRGLSLRVTEAYRRDHA